MNAEELVEKFLEHKELGQGAAPRTCLQYRSVLRRLIVYCDETGIDALAPDQNALSAFAGPHLHKQGLGPIARRPAVAALRGFYRFLYRVGAIADNPAAEIRPRNSCGRRISRPSPAYAMPPSSRP
jgi:site-specific recombinase XerD